MQKHVDDWVQYLHCIAHTSKLIPSWVSSDMQMKRALEDKCTSSGLPKAIAAPLLSDSSCFASAFSGSPFGLVVHLLLTSPETSYSCFLANAIHPWLSITNFFD